MRLPRSGHAPGTEGRHRGGGSPPRIAVRVRRAAIRRGRPSRQQRQAPPGQPGQPGARRPGAQPRSRPRPATRPGAHRVAASPARVADREAGPAASSQPLIRRSPVTAGVASACARVRVVKGAGAPLVSGGRSGKTGKDGAVRVWLAGVAGACPRVRHHPGFPGCGPHPARKESLHLPPGVPWNYSSRARCRRHRPVRRMRTWPPLTGRERGPPRPPPRQSHAPRWPRLPPCLRSVARIQAGHSTREMPLFPLKGNACNSSCFTIRLPPVGRNSGGIPCSAHARAFSGLPSQ